MSGRVYLARPVAVLKGVATGARKAGGGRKRHSSEGNGRAVCGCRNTSRRGRKAELRSRRQALPTRPDKNGWRSEELISRGEATPSGSQEPGLVSPERRPAVEESHHNKNQRATQVPSGNCGGQRRKPIPHRRPAGRQNRFSGAGSRYTKTAAAACTCEVATFPESRFGGSCGRRSCAAVGFGPPQRNFVFTAYPSQPTA